MVRDAVYLLAKGTPVDLSPQYRQRQFQSRGSTIEEARTVMAFPYGRRAEFYTSVYNRLVRRFPWILCGLAWPRESSWRWSSRP